MSSEEVTHILINRCYGGFDISDEALELYKQYLVQNDPLAKTDPEFFCIYDCLRHDPILVKVYDELGENFNPKYTRVRKITIPKRYENYYVITEYDGDEKCNIDYNRYKIDQISQVLSNEMNNDDKIKKINEIVNKIDKEINLTPQI